MEFLIFLIIIAVIAGGVYLFKDTTNSAPVVEKVSSKPSSNVPSVAELKKLTKQQLFDLAEKKNIKVKKSGTKAEVVKQISSAK
jgi:hypothetical protein